MTFRHGHLGVGHLCPVNYTPSCFGTKGKTFFFSKMFFRKKKFFFPKIFSPKKTFSPKKIFLQKKVFCFKLHCFLQKNNLFKFFLKTYFSFPFRKHIFLFRKLFQQKVFQTKKFYLIKMLIFLKLFI